MNMIYRTRQLMMNLVSRIVSQPEPQLFKGSGCIYEIPGVLICSKIGKVLVVTTPGTVRRGTLKKFFEAMESSGIHFEVFTNVPPDPTIECVESAVKAYKDGRCEAIVAIGGGSVIDCSKATGARIAKPRKTIRDMRGILKIRKRLPFMIAVPTTAGTGSEATAAAVITDTIDGLHYKYSLSDPCLIPKVAVLDPDLLLSLPPEATAATGMDALTHAVEAYTNRYASPLVRRKALEAVRLIYENLPISYKDGKDVKARMNMLLASYYAGIAFTNNYVGYVHALAHGIGALYGIPHGLANSIILPYVMEQFGISVSKKLAELGAAAGISNAADSKMAMEFIGSIREMNSSMNIPDRIESLKRKDFDTLIARAVSEANPAYPVPQIWGYKDFEKLLNKLVCI